jgi:hypothetical protein
VQLHSLKAVPIKFRERTNLDKYWDCNDKSIQQEIEDFVVVDNLFLGFFCLVLFVFFYPSPSLGFLAVFVLFSFIVLKKKP